MRLVIAMLCSGGLGFVIHDLFFDHPHAADIRGAMIAELQQMQNAPETGKCIARTWRAYTEETQSQAH